MSRREEGKGGVKVLPSGLVVLCNFFKTKGKKKSSSMRMFDICTYNLWLSTEMFNPVQ